MYILEYGLATETYAVMLLEDGSVYLPFYQDVYEDKAIPGPGAGYGESGTVLRRLVGQAAANAHRRARRKVRVSGTGRAKKTVTTATGRPRFSAVGSATGRGRIWAGASVSLKATATADATGRLFLGDEELAALALHLLE